MGWRRWVVVGAAAVAVMAQPPAEASSPQQTRYVGATGGVVEQCREDAAAPGIGRACFVAPSGSETVSIEVEDVTGATVAFVVQDTSGRSSSVHCGRGSVRVPGSVVVVSFRAGAGCPNGGAATAGTVTATFS
jgi:hypothetical protein